MSPNANYVFICSAGHSGSTLLDLLLGSHSRISSLGEIIMLSKNISLNSLCTCGLPVRSCEVWKQVLSLLSEDLGVDLLTHPYALHMGYANPLVVKDQVHGTVSYHVKRRLLKGLRYAQLRYDLNVLKLFLGSIYQGIENTFRVYDAVRKVLKSDIVVDSSKAYIEAVGVYLRDPSRVRIVQLSRDGRGVFHSYVKRKFPRSESLYGWKNHYARALPLLEKHVNPAHLIRVKYEELVSDPRAELTRLCEFLGVEFEPDMLNYADHVHHMTDGNNMRFKKSSEIRLDDAWRRLLSPADCAYFERIAGDVNRRLGYE